MPRQAVLAMAVMASVIVGIVLGGQMIESPEAVIPMTMEVLILLGITFFFLRREHDREARAWLAKIIMVALLLRLGALFAVHFGLGNPMFFALDQLNYAREGARNREGQWRQSIGEEEK